MIIIIIIISTIIIIIITIIIKIYVTQKSIQCSDALNEKISPKILKHVFLNKQNNLKCIQISKTNKHNNQKIVVYVHFTCPLLSTTNSICKWRWKLPVVYAGFLTSLGPLSPNIHKHILLTVLYIFLMILLGRICWSGKIVYLGWSFLLLSWPVFLIKYWYCKGN